MGRGTEAAVLAAPAVNPTGTQMYGAVVVRVNGALIWHDRAYFSIEGVNAGAHVETRLMCSLLGEGAASIRGAAGDVRITLYTRYSPCRQCLANLEKLAIAKLGELNSRTFLKVVFDRYYTAANHGGDTKASRDDYWASDQEAADAYMKATQASSMATVWKAFPIEGDLSRLAPADREPIWMQKNRPRMIIKKVGGAGMSTPWDF